MSPSAKPSPPSGELEVGPVVPFTILTGWLGAGKTTVLNRLLTHRPQRRIAVLVNELGRISIDTQLILRRGSDVLELAGGCICCSVDLKNDLWDGIADIIQRSSPDHVVLETTGIAEPAAILEGLVRLPDAMRKRVAPAGVICVVDAAHAMTALAEREEAREQVQAADRLLLSKLDIATPAQVAACHRRLDELNPKAERASFPLDDAGSVALAEWLLTPRMATEHGAHGHGHGPHDPAHREHAHHAHAHRHGQLVAAAFVDEAPLVQGRLLEVVRALLPQLVRVKGFVHLAGEPQRFFLELAGTQLELREAGPWPEAADGDRGDDRSDDRSDGLRARRRTELVLIGDDLDEPALLRALWACRAGG
jgi:G3E family GTPase